MQLKRNVQSDTDKLKDRVFAAMETGNQGQARTLLREFKELAPDEAAALHADVIAEYGVAL